MLVSHMAHDSHYKLSIIRCVRFLCLVRVDTYVNVVEVIYSYTVNWKMIAIKNNCDFDSTPLIVNYLFCKINANSGN